MGRTCLVLLRRLCSYFSALLQQYFSVNEQCFPLTTNQYQRQQPNFSEPNRASIFCIEQIFISSATGSRMPALRSFPVVTDQRSYLSMKMNSQRVQLKRAAEWAPPHLYVFSLCPDLITPILCSNYFVAFPFLVHLMVGRWHALLKQWNLKRAYYAGILSSFVPLQRIWIKSRVLVQ
jgi:hypothetical protein